MDADRQLDVGQLADEVPERDLRRPGQCGPRLDHLLGLQRRDSDHAGPRVQRDGGRHVHEPQRRGRCPGIRHAVLRRRPAGERRRP